MKVIRSAGLGLVDIEKEHFPLPTLTDTIEAVRREVWEGRSFVVLRQLPVEAFTKDEIGMIYWGLGTHLGIGQSQSVMGDRLGHMKDSPNNRDHRTARASYRG
ncbi:MAG: hypothetical protein JO339_24790 [Alphaproteobacteria bacterium]|nr:hypothetical protein [Alphaproteobacteria bacterium]